MAASPDRRVNLAVARIIPPILLGIVIYASYIVTKQLCIDYLISPFPRYNRSPRVGAGAAILVVFYVLLFPVIVTYLRLLYNVVWNPGYLPLGAPSMQAQEDDTRPSDDRPSRKHHRRRSSRPGAKNNEKPDRPEENVDVERGSDYSAGGKAYPLDTTGLESFYTKDIFVCKLDGKPSWCSTCCQFKTDRAHHCREVDRCVRKMDHFCPWVGGVVSETSFKFFIQFVFYTALFCAFSLIVCAVFIAEHKGETGQVNSHWAVGLGLSGLFCLFTIGMTISSIQLAVFNLTTIENLNRGSAVWTFAIRVPDHILRKFDAQWAPTFRTVTYPIQPVPSGPEAPPQDPTTGERHVFAILQTSPGENPFDLGSPLKNLQQVLGYTVLDWLLPFKQSPCADHSSLESAFELGPVVKRIRREAGLEYPVETETADPANRRSKHDRRRGKSRRRH